MRKTSDQFIAVVWKERRRFVSQCLNIDLSSFGKTELEAVKNLEEALALYLEDHPKRIPAMESPAIFIRELQYA